MEQDPLANTDLSHYRIVSKIGAGGMGEVYLAEDTRLNRKVALKLLSDEFSNDSDKLHRFIQEAKAASALNHPNILTVYEIGSHDGKEYIAAELIDGVTLRERMGRSTMKLLDALDITLQITAALGAAHEAGIIHRDIKPENIMIRKDGLVKVLDFGLAKLSGVSAESIQTTMPHLVTKSGMVVGTVAYMSPEQARGREIDPRSDIFSLGIVMFELYTGKRPFDGESHLDLISSILKDDPPALRDVSPDLPRQLERIVGKSLRKDRDLRYQHVRDLHIDIEDLKDELKVEAKLSKNVQPTIDGRIHATNQSKLRSAFTTNITETRRFTLLHALIFAAVAATLVGAVWYFRSGGSPVSRPFKPIEVATWTAAQGELTASASFSPDGKMIAFASTKSGTKSIWVTQTASTEPLQITNDAFANTGPIWSPNGDEIAYLSIRAGNATGIWRVGALGGTPRSVGPVTDGSCRLRRWTSSGRIYYELRGELYALDLSSGSSQKMTAMGNPQIKWISISPDEKTLAYLVQNTDQWQIFTSDITGTKPLEAVKGVGSKAPEIAWAPEKKRLYYSISGNEAPQIFMVSTDSGHNTELASPETISSLVDASADGRSVILSSAKEESNLWRVSVADGQEAPVARDLNAKLWPAVSPDREKIAFQSIKDLSAGDNLLRGNIVVRNLKAADGDRPTLLAEKGFLPEWAPDGSSLAFLKSDGNDIGLFLVNGSGGGERRIFSGSVEPLGYSVSPYNVTQSRAFTWSADGSRVALVSKKDGSPDIWIVNIRDRSETRLTNNPEGSVFSSPVWSPDGQQIAFSYQKKGKDQNGNTVRGLRTVDVRGNIAQIFETSRVIRLIGWSADGKSLVIAESSKDFSGLPPETNLSRIAIAGGAESPIASLKNVYFYNIFLSEDKKQIAFAARDQNMDNIWVIPSIGGTPRRLTNNNDSGLYYSRLGWLSDGTAIVFGKQTRFSLLSRVTDIE